MGLVFELQGQSKEPQAKVALLRGSLAPTQHWVPQSLRSRLGPLSTQLNVNLCVCVYAEHGGRGGLQVTMTAPPAPGTGHAGDPNLRTRTQTKRGQALAPLSSLSQYVHPSWALEGFAMNRTGAIFFIFLFGYPHLLEGVQ